MGLQGQDSPPEEKSAVFIDGADTEQAADLLIGVRRAVTELQSIPVVRALPAENVPMRQSSQPHQIGDADRPGRSAR